MWTDKVLSELQMLKTPTPPEEVVTRDNLSDLYRLARLGLAAEQVGEVNLRSAIELPVVTQWDTDEVAALVDFLNHPAWEAK